MSGPLSPLPAELPHWAADGGLSAEDWTAVVEAARKHPKLFPLEAPEDFDDGQAGWARVLRARVRLAEHFDRGSVEAPPMPKQWWTPRRMQALRMAEVLREKIDEAVEQMRAGARWQVDDDEAAAKAVDEAAAKAVDEAAAKAVDEAAAKAVALLESLHAKAFGRRDNTSEIRMHVVRAIVEEAEGDKHALSGLWGRFPTTWGGIDRRKWSAAVKLWSEGNPGGRGKTAELKRWDAIRAVVADVEGPGCPSADDLEHAWSKWRAKHR